MGKAIRKLNQLIKPESFIQINTIRGFKYVDRAGEITNAYYKGDNAPDFTMSLSGLVIRQPDQHIEELKITPNNIWAKFESVDSLNSVADNFNHHAKKILPILEVDSVSRVGWRTYFVYEFSSKEDQEKYLEKFSVIRGAKPVVLRFQLEEDKRFKVNLIVQPVIKDDQTKTPGVLFDADVYQTGEIGVQTIPAVLKTFREYMMNDDGLLGTFNSTFE